MRDAAQGTANAYDQVWCVFDRDSFSPVACRQAFQLAEQEKIHVAFSNEAFEIWYLLHFDYHDAALSRTQYGEKLTKALTHPYAKNSETIYDELYTKQADALRNAKALHRQYAGARLEDSNPCTTVYQLVESLNRFLR